MFIYILDLYICPLNISNYWPQCFFFLFFQSTVYALQNKQKIFIYASINQSHTYKYTNTRKYKYTYAYAMPTYLNYVLLPFAHGNKIAYHYHHHHHPPQYTTTTISTSSSSSWSSSLHWNIHGNVHMAIYHGTGWFNSLTDVVKRRFAKYVKSHLVSSDKVSATDDQPKFYRLPFLDKYRTEKTTNSPAASQNPTAFAASPAHNMAHDVHTKVPAPSQIHSGIDRRHRSPDPPPRFNRGQSPLLLRRNLLNRATGSPILTRRYVSTLYFHISYMYIYMHV